MRTHGLSACSVLLFPASPPGEWTTGPLSTCSPSAPAERSEEFRRPALGHTEAVTEHLTEAVLQHPVQGRGLRGDTFGDELGTGATLVVALRHPG